MNSDGVTVVQGEKESSEEWRVYIVINTYLTTLLRWWIEMKGLRDSEVTEVDPMKKIFQKTEKNLKSNYTLVTCINTPCCTTKLCTYLMHRRFSPINRIGIEI